MRSSTLGFLALALALVFSPHANAQCKDSVVGTWKLVTVKATTDKGDVDKTVLGQILRAFSRTRPMAE